MDITGNLPFNYSVVDRPRTESFDANGSRATVTFIGPYEDRVKFLDEIFGYWVIGVNNNGCCIVPEMIGLGFENDANGIPRISTANLGTMYPKAYPRVDDSFGRPNSDPRPASGLWTINKDHYFMWPDSYSIEIVGDPTPPAFDYWFTGEGVLGTNSTTQEALWQPHGGCTAEITVNYVSKNTQIPVGFANCSCFNITEEIPRGVFVEIDYSPTLESVSIPGRTFEFTKGHYENKGLVVRDDDCPDDSDQVPDEISDLLHIYGGQIAIRLSNFPFPYTPKMLEVNNTVNINPFLGFPAESLALQIGTPVPRKNHRGLDIYDIELTFLIRMSDFCEDSNEGLEEDVRLAIGAACGRIGIWNKRWRSCPIQLNGTNTSAAGCCTHWQEVQSASGCTPRPAIQDEILENDEQTHESAIPYADWDGLFDLPECPEEEA